MTSFTLTTPFAICSPLINIYYKFPVSCAIVVHYFESLPIHYSTSFFFQLCMPFLTQPVIFFHPFPPPQLV